MISDPRRPLPTPIGDVRGATQKPQEPTGWLTALAAASGPAANDPIADIRVMSQHRSVATSYFLPKAADDADISPWAAILPPGAQVLCTNLFGDAFVADLGGAVHILDRGGCTVEQIATSREEFWHEVQDDPHDRQLRNLADACRAAGNLLGPDQCFAFTIPPILGGDYHVENIWVAPWREWFSLAADVFRQVKDLPDGAKVRFEVGD